MKIIILLSFLTFVSCAKLNVPKLLLPFHSNVATNFTLEVSEGCFTWRSTRPEIASIQHDSTTNNAQSCSLTAVVVATSRVPSRKTAVIIAEDPVSGHQLRCDVIVDAINSIAIETTTHELYLDDSPEEFVLRAMNDEDDVFSSLSGMTFDWNLLPDTELGKNLAPANNIIRLMSYAESAYEALPYVQSLEQQGKRADRILVKGIGTGIAKATVRPSDSALKHVKESVVRIVVMANIQLNPPLVYVIQYTTVHYRVELLKQNKVYEIQMPSLQYRLAVRDAGIAVLTEQTCTVKALQMGDTEVVLKDTHIHVPGIFREPTAAIYVVNPGYLAFQVFPDNNWVLQTDRVYEVTIEIYDKESRKIYPSENIRVEATFDAEYFQVLRSSSNGTYHVVKTLQRGLTSIRGMLNTVILKNGTKHTFEPAIENSQDAEIYDPVHVHPPLVVLPWLPLQQTNNMFQLKATGGSGNYTWLSSDTDVATATTKGQVVTALKTGETFVKAADTKNPAHYDTMQTLVLPPGKMEFLASRVEAEIGTVLNLPLAVYASKGGKNLAFAECHLMPFDVTIDDRVVFGFEEATTTTVAGSCAGIRVKAKAQGHTEVIVSYTYQTTKLIARVNIAAYKPLKAIDPEELALVTKASSRDILFEGGPQPWMLDPSTYFEVLAAESTPDVRIDLKKDAKKSRHLFQVLCKQYGEQTLTLNVGNKVTQYNKFPAQAQAAVRFGCAEPRAMRLIPLVQHPQGLPPCPINAEYDDPVPVHCYDDLELQVVVKDEQGRRFDNFSSMAFDWTLSDQSLASFAVGESGLITEVRADKTYPVIIGYRTLSMQSVVGSVDVTSSASSYDKSYFSAVGLVSDSLSFSTALSDTRTLSLVNDAQIEPAAITLYNHDTHKAGMRITQGSGHFQVTYANAKPAKVYHDDKSRDIRLVPEAEGQFIIVADDLCLEPETAATGKVFVSDVHQIMLNVVDKVQIDGEIEAVVRVLDSRAQPIPAKYFTKMSLKPKTGDSIIAVTPMTEKYSADEMSAVYRVKGAALGRTPLQFIATQKSGALIASAPQEIQVFPPLRLEPRNITMIIGATFQVAANGGPQPQSTIEFNLKDKKLGSVTNTGVIEALALGTTLITGRAVGLNADNTRVVYSQDQVTVNVVELVGIKIFAPLKRLRTDTQIPLYAMGLGENETPFTFGSSSPPLQFDWTISNSEVANLKPIFYKSGITPTSDNNFAVRLLADRAGHVTVKLSVTPATGSWQQIKNNNILSDTVQIQVFEKLRVTSPDVCDGTLLITPNTETKLRTNRDGSSARVTYQVQRRDVTPTIATVDKYGHLATSSHTGVVSVVITSHEEFGVNQSVVIAVTVRPVSYLMLNSDTVLHTQGHDLTAVPLGTTLSLSVSFHDAVGERFYATDSKIHYKPNRFDLLQILHGGENDTLVARATNIGQTVIKVWDRERPGLVDYVNIGVGYAIAPAQSDVTLGDVICLHSALVTESGHQGKWHADNGVVSIDEHTGVALATQSGTAVVSYNITSSMATHTQVRVRPISGMSLERKPSVYLTNVQTKFTDLLFPVQVTDENGEVLTTNIHGHNCTERLSDLKYSVHQPPVRCEATLTSTNHHVIVEELVTTATEFDVQTGGYRCRLTQHSAPSLTPLISHLDSSISLRVTVPSRDGQRTVTSLPLLLPYIPAFHVHTSQLVLSNEMHVTKLRVSGTEKVLSNLKISAVDDTLVSIDEPERDLHGNIASYPIRLQITSSLWDRNQLETEIEMQCGLTGHAQSVPVHVTLVGSKETQQKLAMTWRDVVVSVSKTDYYQLLFLVLAAIATVACLVIAYHVMFGARYTSASQQSGVFAPPGGSPQQQFSYSGVASPFNQTLLNSSGTPPRLWSVDYGPYDNSGIFKRSPLQQSPRS